MRTASLLPSLLRRLDDMLLVKELNASLSEHRLDETLLHHAITSSTAMMEFDYERLELLGKLFQKILRSAAD
jgi:endoribonuclease Dicer